MASKQVTCFADALDIFAILGIAVLFFHFCIASPVCSRSYLCILRWTHYFLLLSSAFIKSSLLLGPFIRPVAWLVAPMYVTAQPTCVYDDGDYRYEPHLVVDVT